MKKYIIILAAALVSLGAAAQDAEPAVEAAQNIAEAADAAVKAPRFADFWTESLKTNITAGQTGLLNWAAGGDNTFSLAAYIDGNANYKKDEMFWNNRLQLDYGLLYASSKPIFQKNTDRIYLESKWGYQIHDKLFFTANYDFKSQFSKGYNYNTPGTAIIQDIDPSATDINDLSKKDQRQAWKEAREGKSNFVSPAYTNLALGIDWKPKDWFSVSFAPLTGGYVIVVDPAYRSTYNMGVKKGYEKGTTEFDDAVAAAEEKGFSGGSLSPYKSHRFEFGAQLKVDLKAQINDNFTYSTQLVLFEDYIKDHKMYPCPRINWDNRIDWKLAKYFALTVTTNLIYDDMIMFSTDRYTEKCSKNTRYNEKWGANGAGPLVQFKECVSFGFTWTIASKK